MYVTTRFQCLKFLHLLRSVGNNNDDTSDSLMYINSLVLDTLNLFENARGKKPFRARKLLISRMKVMFSLKITYVSLGKTDSKCWLPQVAIP